MIPSCQIDAGCSEQAVRAPVRSRHRTDPNEGTCIHKLNQPHPHSVLSGAIHGIMPFGFRCVDDNLRLPAVLIMCGLTALRVSIPLEILQESYGTARAYCCNPQAYSWLCWQLSKVGITLTCHVE